MSFCLSVQLGVVIARLGCPAASALGELLISLLPQLFAESSFSKTTGFVYGLLAHSLFSFTRFLEGHYPQGFLLFIFLPGWLSTWLRPGVTLNPDGS